MSSCSPPVPPWVKVRMPSVSGRSRHRRRRDGGQRLLLRRPRIRHARRRLQEADAQPLHLARRPLQITPRAAQRLLRPLHRLVQAGEPVQLRLKDRLRHRAAHDGLARRRAAELPRIARSPGGREQLAPAQRLVRRPRDDGVNLVQVIEQPALRVDHALDDRGPHTLHTREKPSIFWKTRMTTRIPPHPHPRQGEKSPHSPFVSFRDESRNQNRGTKKKTPRPPPPQPSQMMPNAI